MPSEIFSRSTSTLIINQSHLDTSDSSNSRYIYPLPATMNISKTKVCLQKINVYYSWFNIEAARGNNTFSYIWTDGGGSTQYDLTIVDGYYSISDLNAWLQSQMISNGHYLVDGSSNYVYYLEFVTNSNYYSAQLNSYALPTSLPIGYSNPGLIVFPAVASTPQVIINANAFRDVIGFNAGTYPAAVQATTYSKISDYTPQVSPVQSITVLCNLVSNDMANPSNLMYSFTAAGVGFGGLIESSPNQLEFLNINPGYYNNVICELRDQQFNRVDFKDPNILIQLLFTTLIDEVKM